MVSFSIRSRVRPDGTVQVEIPTGLPETEVEVLVVVQPVTKQPPSGAGPDETWLDGSSA